MLLIYTILFISQTWAGWVDPHSMDSQTLRKFKNESPKTTISKGSCPTLVETHSDLHMKRIVRIILQHAEFAEERGKLIGQLNLKLSNTDLNTLSNFAKSTVNTAEMFHEVGSIFEDAFQVPKLEQYKKAVLSFTDRIVSFVFSPTVIATEVCILFLFVTYTLLKANFTWWSIFKYFIFLSYLADYVITYLQILQEQEVDRRVQIEKFGFAPPECETAKMSWGSYILTAFTENRCKEYYVATNQNLKYLVAPSKVLRHQYNQFIVNPLGDLGTAMGKFGSNMFVQLPWGLNVILFPIMLIISLAIIFMILLFSTGKVFKLNIFHLFSIELNNKKERKPEVKSSKRNEYVRNYVEDVKPSKETLKVKEKQAIFKKEMKSIKEIKSSMEPKSSKEMVSKKRKVPNTD